MAKSIMLMVWVAIVASLVFTFPPLISTVLQVIGVLLLVGHLAEYFVYRSKIGAKGDGTVKSLLMTMLFGVIYIKNL